MSPTPVPSPCNICGGVEFTSAPNARLSPSGLPSHCRGCGSLEHHRVARSVFNGLPRPMLEGSRCLRLTVDRALEPAWFAELTTLTERGAPGVRIERSDASCDWIYASLSLTGGADERATLEDLLRVVGTGFVVLVDGALAERYSAEEPKGSADAGPRARGSFYGDALRALLPQAALLEIVAMDPSSLTLDSVFIVSRDARRLKQMAAGLARHNIHPRVFAGDSLEAQTSQEALSDARAALAPEFDAAIYRSLHADLARFSDADLRSHYRRHGQGEGRRAHRLGDRVAFIELVTPELDALEIALPHQRLRNGPRVRHLDPRSVELSDVDEQFDVVLSSHFVEHQPDFVAHLDGVRRLLRPGGLYFALIPDRNYCFDHFMAPSTIAALLEAHVEGRTLHTLRSQIAHAALRTHNDSARHWRGDHGAVAPSRDVVAQTVAQHLRRGSRYEDVHAWYFDPASLQQTMGLLAELGETDFRVLRLYPTQANSDEFWVIFEASGGES